VWSASALHDQGEFQLIAITSLYIVIKLNERVAANAEFFSAVSEGGYSIRDIEDVENILMVLS
jgi:hypothetical protein